MVTCPACGKENEDSAYECKRCRAPLRDGEPSVDVAAPQSMGEVCHRCEAYNEPGVTACTNCGLPLHAGSAPSASPAPPPTPATKVPETLSEELRALAISDEEAAEAGLTLAARNGDPFDKTPPQPFPAPGVLPPAPTAARPRVGEFPTAVAGAASPARRPPPAPPPPSRIRTPPETAVIPAALPASKPCASCGALNPPAAKFCFDCGTPFAKKGSAASPPPPSIEVAAELEVEFDDDTMQSAPVRADEAVPADSVAEPIPEEQPPPFAAKLVLEAGEGTEFPLAHLENSLGGSAAHIGLGDDPYLAPHAATVAFVDERLVVRDESSVNGVYVKVRESAALEPGDLFIAGERLFRYDGPVDIARSQADPPLLGAPRPRDATLYRVTEVLFGARTGRTCHRAPPAISIGRTGCDMNFGSDTLLAARHAEVRIAEDGTTTLVDLGEGPSGVFLRVRPQQPIELQAGDVVRIGDHRLRVELGS